MRSKNETRQKKSVNKNAIIALLSIFSSVLVGICLVLAYNMVRLSNVSMFSQNFNLNSNYFLNKYDENDNIGSEPVEDDNFREISNTMSGYTASVIYKINDLYGNGLITKNESDSALVYAQTSIRDAEKYINSCLGFEYFIDSDDFFMDVPYISQEGILPNGCEAVSATMLLRFCGYDISPVDFVNNYLAKDEIYVKWGVRYGPDPRTAYAGDPASNNGGWGCFSPVIVTALNKYLDNEYHAYNITGNSLDSIVYNYIMNEVPVAIWVTADMTDVSEVYQWRSYDKSETYLYPVGEHCMVLTGYDGKYLYFNDPLNSNGQVKYEFDRVASCFSSMGKQAVVIINKDLEKLYRSELKSEN